MFNKIMVPVDLEHGDTLGKAVSAAADLARAYNGQIVFVGVTAETPTPVAHNPTEYAEKLAVFAKTKGSEQGLNIESKAVASHDPTIDLDKTLLEVAAEVGADVIVIASHVPHFADLLTHAHGGSIAAHAPISVFVIR